MPIIRISRTQIVQECAHCHAHHIHVVSSLQLGVDFGSADFIQLPQCSCCAIESLARNLTAPPSNDRSHRKAVNALALLLKQAGRVEEAHAEVYANDSEPRDTMDITGEVAVEPTLVQQ